MKWLIYGSGWIGNMVINELSKIGESVFIGKVRVDDEKNLKEEIASINPDRILCFIGRTHGGNVSTIDYLELPGKLKDNIRDNLYAPLVLSHLAKSMGIHLTYLGTGCIFNYDSLHNTEIGFTEEDSPNFFGSSYSIVKGFTDRLLHQFDDDVLNLRIRMPITYDDSPRNFITKITSYEKICSNPNSMTVLPDFIPIIIDLSKKKYTGTLNLTNPGVISHNEILEKYKEIVDSEFTWKNFDQNEHDKILSSKRSNNLLDTQKLQKLYPEIKPIKESIITVLNNIKKNKCI